MRRLWIAVIAAASTVALMQMASAADLPVKAPRYAPPPPPPPFSWTGFYAGLHAGVGWPTGTDTSASLFSERFKNGNLQEKGGFTAAGFDTDSDRPFLFGGGYLGYNYQINAFVLGLEADISGATDRRDNRTLFLNNSNHTFQIDSEFGMDWFGTVRARAGYLVNPAWLLYATGGFAYGNVENNVTGTLSIDNCGAGGSGAINCPTIFSSSDSGVKTGWTIGGGTEFSLGTEGHWHAKFEYLYVDLEDSNGSFPVTTTQLLNKTAGNNTFTEFATTSAAWNQKNQFHTFKVGLSYQF